MSWENSRISQDIFQNIENIQESLGGTRSFEEKCSKSSCIFKDFLGKFWIIKDILGTFKDVSRLFGNFFEFPRKNHCRNFRRVFWRNLGIFKEVLAKLNFQNIFQNFIYIQEWKYSDISRIISKSECVFMNALGKFLNI